MGERVEDQFFNWVEDSNWEMPFTGRKRRRPKRKEFVGWGSKQLVEFLESIGKSTNEALAQQDVASIINQYIIDNKLINPAKKKRVLCDARLQALFGRKSVGRHMIYELLESHFAANECDSENDLFYSSDEREEEKHIDHMPQNNSTSDGKTYKRKKEALQSYFAAITPDNIKLVFLRKSLVEDLVKDPTTFEGKVLGSFVRVKSDPYDYSQKNSHVLQVVTGVKKDAIDSDKVRLEIADMGKQINISELSEQNFSEEECKDLHRRIKDSLIKQPTVAELQEKVQILHEDITKHWLEREMSHLGSLMDRANEKGWRREFFEYREKRKLLQTPAEQSRLLQTVPQVIAEELKVDSVPADAEHCPKEATTDQPSQIDWVISDYQPPDRVATTCGGADLKAQESEPPKVEGETNIQFQPLRGEMNIQFQPSRVEADCAVEQLTNGAMANGHCQSLDPKEMNPGVGSSVRQAEIIDLSDDEEDNIVRGHQQQNHMSPLVERVWHYLDPQGVVQGPFPLTSLKCWNDLKYFPPGFTVWKSGQSPSEGVLLSKVLREEFSR